MADGIALPIGSATIILKANFGGFLADLLAHKELMCSKGVSNAIHPCWNCANLSMRSNGRYSPEERTLACSDMAQFMSYSDEVLLGMVDRLHDSVGSMTQRQLAELQTSCGFNIEPEGIMRDRTLRDIQVIF